jgi:hypothetical protein
MLGENTNLNSGAVITGNFTVPGTPTVKINGSPVTYGGAVAGTGATTPTNYTVTLNSNTTLGRLLTQTDGSALPVVAAPPTPTGTRNVSISNAGQSVGDFTTLQNLNLNANVGDYAIPAGTYGDFSCGSGSAFVLGTAGATSPSIYNFQHLTINSGGSIKLVGPVLITVANGSSINGPIGRSDQPGWLTLQYSSGGLNLNQPAVVYGTVLAPNGTVTINNTCLLSGNVVCANLAVQSGGKLHVNQPPTATLTAPASGTVVVAPGTLTISASASDPDSPIAGVDFYAGTTKIGYATSAPYAFTWNNAPAGTYTVTAVATDIYGASSTSEPITLIVDTAPVVSIAAPTNGTVFTAPGLISLQATATDLDGTVAKVEFFNGSTKLGESVAAPFQFDWTNVAYGTYTLTAVATDNLGIATTSALVSIVVNQPPAVSITSPNTGAVLIGPANVTLTASASDVDGSVTQVSFFSGNTKLGDATASSGQPSFFTLPVTLTPGTYSITAIAADNLGASTTSASIALKVDAPPSATLTAPASGQVLVAPATVTLTASAADADGTIARIEFLQGGTVIATVTTAPYTYTVPNLAAGSYTFGARAIDDAGAVSPLSTATILVNAPPTVSITAPTDGATFVAGKAITLTANAADSDGSVARVEFFQGNVKLGEAVAAPFAMSWTNAAVGQYTITARATDDRGAATDSGAVTVIVDTPPAATAQAVTAIAGKPVDIVLAGTDADADPLTYSIVTQPQYGTLGVISVDAHGAASVRYTPASNYAGADAFTFRAYDGKLYSSASTISLTVQPANEPPVASASSITTNEDASVSIPLTATDANNDPLTYTIVTQPQHGTLGAVTSNGGAISVLYMPAVHYIGSDSFTFKANDGMVDSPTATISIDVARPPNRAPAFVSTPPATMEVRGALGGAGMLHGTIRDFSKQHPNFEHYNDNFVWISYDVVQLC